MKIEEFAGERKNPIVRFEYKTLKSVRMDIEMEYDARVAVVVNLVDDEVSLERIENSITKFKFTGKAYGDEIKHFASCINSPNSERVFEKPGDDRYVKLTYLDGTEAEYVGSWETDYEMMALEVAEDSLNLWAGLNSNEPIYSCM